jgi:hypothetical protein
LSISGIPVAFLSAASKLQTDETAAQNEIAAELAQTCSIELSGEMIHAEHAEWRYGDFSSSVIVTFPRSTHPIRATDSEANVQGRIGTTTFQAAFILKKMTYKGTLQL